MVMTSVFSVLGILSVVVGAFIVALFAAVLWKLNKALDIWLRQHKGE